LIQPETRSPAIWQDGRAKSQIHGSLSNTESDRAALDLQAGKLRRLYFFCHDTARTIANLAYGMAR
jgi:hypothetical protein